MHGPFPPELAAWLAACDRVLEVGVGRRFELATHLAERGVHVTAIDVEPGSPPPRVRVLTADVHALDPALVAPIDAVYALNLPPELQPPTAAAAAGLDAPCRFTTLGADPTVVPADVVVGGHDPVFAIRRPGSNNV